MFGGGKATFGAVPTNTGSLVFNNTATSSHFGRTAFGIPATSEVGADPSLSSQQMTQSLFATNCAQPQKPSLFGGTSNSIGLGSTTTTQPEVVDFTKSLQNTFIFGDVQPKEISTPMFGQPTTTPAFSSFAEPNCFGKMGQTRQQTSTFFFGRPAASNISSDFGSLGQTTPTTTSVFGSVTASASYQPANTANTGFYIAKYQPTNSIDITNVNGHENQVNTKHHCITAMKEYEGKSFEELRMEEYSANPKGPKNGRARGPGGFEPTTQSNADAFGFQPPARTKPAFSNFTKPLQNAFVFEGAQPKAKSYSLFGQPTSTSVFGTSWQTGAQASTFFFNHPSASNGTTGFGPFGQTSSTTTSVSTFSQPANGAANPGSSIAKYQPTNGIDISKVNGYENRVNTKQHSITTMKEYEGKSFEELRMEDYSANRKGPTKGDVGRLGRIGFIPQSIFSAQPPTTTVSARKVFGHNRIPHNGRKPSNAFKTRDVTTTKTAFCSFSQLQQNNSILGDAQLQKKLSSSFGQPTSISVCSAAVKPAGFGTFGCGFASFRQTVPTANRAANYGTSIAKYQTTIDIEIIKTTAQDIWQGTKQHSITSMKEYEAKSFEELRMEDYLANRKGIQRSLRGLKSAAGTILFSTTNQLSTGLYSQPVPYSSQNKSIFGFTRTKPLPLGAKPLGLQTFGQTVTGFETRFGTTAGQQQQPDPNKPVFGLRQTPTNFDTFGTAAMKAASIGLNEEKSSTGFGTRNANTGLQNFNSCVGGGPIFNLNLQPATLASGAFANSTSTSAPLRFNTGTGQMSPFESSASKPKGPFFKTLEAATNTKCGGLLVPLEQFAFGLDHQNKGFGQTIDASLGSLGGLPETPQQQEQLSIHQQILSKVTSPYGDNPIFQHLKCNEENDATRETNSAQKGNKENTNNSGQQLKISANSSPNIIKLKPIVSAFIKKSLFEGLEDFDDSFILKPKNDKTIGGAASGPQIGSETNLNPPQQEQDMRNDSLSKEILSTISGTQSAAPSCNEVSTNAASELLTSIRDANRRKSLLHPNNLEKVEPQNQNSGTDAVSSNNSISTELMSFEEPGNILSKEESNATVNERKASSNPSNAVEEKSILILMFELNPFT